MDDKTEKGMPRGFNFVEALQRKNRLSRSSVEPRFCPAGCIGLNGFFVSGENASQPIHRYYSMFILPGVHLYSSSSYDHKKEDWGFGGN